CISSLVLLRLLPLTTSFFPYTTLFRSVLVSKLDTKFLIIFGCVVSSLALFVMAGWDLGLDFRHAVEARMLQGFGLAFLFIPINRSEEHTSELQSHLNLVCRFLLEKK